MPQPPTPDPASARGSSPCIGVCRMNERTGWCEGCLRDIDEIVAWAALAPDQREQVLAALPARAAEWARLHADGEVPRRPPAARKPVRGAPASRP